MNTAHTLRRAEYLIFSFAFFVFSGSLSAATAPYTTVINCVSTPSVTSTTEIDAPLLLDDSGTVYFTENDENALASGNANGVSLIYPPPGYSPYLYSVGYCTPNNAGQVVFRAPPLGTIPAAFFYMAQGGAITPYVSNSNAALYNFGTSGVWFGSNQIYPSLNDAGQFAFIGVPPLETLSTVFLVGSQGLQPLAVEDGTTPTGRTYDLISDNVLINNAGEVLFHSLTTEGGDSSTTESDYFLYTQNGIKLFFEEGSSILDSVNNHDQAVATGTDGIELITNGIPQLIVPFESILPGNVEFWGDTDIIQVQINDSGNVAFFCLFYDLYGEPLAYGIYLWTPAGIKEVASTLTPLSDGSQLTQFIFADPNAFVFNQDNEIAFTAQTSAGLGLYFWNGTTLTRLMQVGDQVNGLPVTGMYLPCGGGPFLNPAQSVINDSGQVACQVDCGDGMGTSSIGNFIIDGGPATSGSSPGGGTTSGSNPLVFIPGIAGSVLSSNGSPIWPSVRPSNISSLALPNGANAGAIATDIVRSFDTGLGVVPVYAPFISELTTTGGYQEYPLNGDPTRMTSNFDTSNSSATLFTFPYDWRQEIESNVQTLNQYISNIRAIHGNAKVDIVAHSMGGLLARRYIIEHPNDVAHLVTVNSPFWGTPRAVHEILTGNFFPYSTVNFIDNSAIQSTLPTFPSVYELLPSAAYMSNLVPVMGENGWDVNGNHIAYESYYPGEFEHFIDSQIQPFYHGPGWSSAYELNAAFHNYSQSGVGGQDDWTGDQTGIKYLQVISQQTVNDTVRAVQAKSENSFTPGDAGSNNFYQAFMGTGDGTVTTRSAEMSTGTAPGTVRYEPTGLNSTFEHTAFIQQPQLFSIIQQFLNDNLSFSSASVAAEASPPDLSTTASQEITVTGTGYVGISDTNGNQNTLLSSIAAAPVPGVNTEYGGDSQFVDSIAGGSMELIITGSNNSSVTFSVIQEATDGTPLTLRRYDFDSSGHAWEAYVYPASSGSDPAVYVDSNDDGIFESDEQIPVTYSSNSVATISPRLTFSTLRHGNEFVVTLSSTGATALPVAIEYSLNGGPLQQYEKPLSFPKGSSAILQAYAIDSQGNTSPPQQIVLPPAASLPLTAKSFVGTLPSDGGPTGAIALHIGSNGVFTGNAIFGDTAYKLSGLFDLNGTLMSLNIKPPLPIALTLFGTDAAGLEGALSDTTGLTYPFTAYPPAYEKGQSFQAAGRYTLTLTSTNDGSISPAGTGFATINISKTGIATAAGKLADGTAFTAAAPVVAGVSGNELITFSSLNYGSLVSKESKAALIADLAIPAQHSGTFGGLVEWSKPSQTKGPFPAGFETVLLSNGSAYNPPNHSSVLPGFTSGTLSLSDSNGVLLKDVILTLDNAFVVTNPSTDHLQLKINPTTGILSGSFIYNGERKPLSLGGVLLQNGTSGAGLFPWAERTR